MNLNNPDELIDYLILNGAIEAAGIDSKTGEITFNFTSKLKEIFPPLYENFMHQFHEDVMILWADGFLQINVTEANPIVRLTDKALNKEAVEALSNDLRLQLQGIIDALRIQ
jgi:hypothetical protein